jgi:hypothetical protein
MSGKLAADIDHGLFKICGTPEHGSDVMITEEGTVKQSKLQGEETRGRKRKRKAAKAAAG